MRLSETFPGTFNNFSFVEIPHDRGLRQGSTKGPGLSRLQYSVALQSDYQHLGNHNFLVES